MRKADTACVAALRGRLSGISDEAEQQVRLWRRTRKQKIANRELKRRIVEVIKELQEYKKKARQRSILLGKKIATNSRHTQHLQQYAEDQEVLKERAYANALIREEENELLGEEIARIRARNTRLKAQIIVLKNAEKRAVSDDKSCGTKE